MARQPRPPHIVLTPEEQQRLTELVRRRKTPRGLAARAQLILLSAEQPYTSLTKIGEQLGVCRHTVRTWRQRFVQARIAGLRDAPKPGAPRKI